MKILDYVGQGWRIAKARPYIAPGSRVLDVGCADGALFRALAGRIREGVGIDPNGAAAAHNGRYRILTGTFPEAADGLEPFDAIAALAVLEHIPLDRQPAFAGACRDLLRPGGRLILTVPAPLVDRIVHIEQRLHLADGMELHEHFGFEPRQTVPLFTSAGLEVVKVRSFQLRLNNLFVFRRPLNGATD
jgi:cyclopropane fatty-acyl-phospholipid synthase-like methyltransferase